MQRFFAFGYNKSGTTFLQQLLDSHRRVNCPPEHSLKFVLKNAVDFAKQYRGVIQTIDDRTARQGLRYDESFVVAQTVRAQIDAFMKFGADKNTTHIGINDNTLDNNLKYFASLFPTAKFVAIVRDPREIAVSLFHHKMTFEKEFRAQNRTVSHVAEAVGGAWAKRMHALQAFREDPALQGKIAVVRYEDLIGPEQARHLSVVFTHLEVAADRALLDEVLAANAFAKRRDETAQTQGFLRSGRSDSWRTKLPARDVAGIEATAGDAMRAFGYDAREARPDPAGEALQPAAEG